MQGPFALLRTVAFGISAIGRTEICGYTWTGWAGAGWFMSARSVALALCNCDFDVPSVLPFLLAIPYVRIRGYRAGSRLRENHQEVWP